MAVRTPIEQTEELYFITFTCAEECGGWFENPVDYKHSPAKYCVSGMQSGYPIDSE